MKTGIKISPRTIVVGVLALALFAGAFVAVRYLTVTMQAIGGIPGVAITQPDAAASGTDIPGLPTAVPEAPAIELPPTWDGASRVTILLMGVDTEPVVDAAGKVSPDRIGPARSDTMILLTIDPQTKTAGMMSVPRDLWVSIPGFSYAKINTAYFNGESFKLPGGGPELAMRTVEQVIGVPIQYFAQVEFWSFTGLIDQIGKIKVFVPKKIVIDPVGPGEDKIMLSAGYHQLGGVEALAYVRQRHSDGGDVDRSNRQQSVILAVRDKVTDPANFSTLLTNAPLIYNNIQTGIRTNLTFDEIMRLGMLAKDIPPENIKRGVIDYTMVQLDSVVVKGESQSIFKPIPDKIRELRDQIFSSAGAVSPLAKGDPLDLAKQEGATIAVYNGSSVQGMAQRTADYLKSLGFNVILVENASNYPGVTQVISHRSKLYAMKYFKELFAINSGAQLANKDDAAAQADIDIIVADDWAMKNPMP
ncbi:MAG: LCP family protein [Chloroflexi bacterium]|nr:LCP family protein [Chloroflexota bacterium]